MKRVKIGDRIELSPTLDLWMRGARYGTVRKVERNDLGWETVIVRLDNPGIRKLQRIPVHDVRVTDPERGHHYGHCDGKPCTCGMSDT